MGDHLNIILNSDILVREEQNELGSWRKSRGRENQPWTGIALSGGGIRSATFCLGVLQALANKDRLKHFDYISTVSGGGYVGCSLQWWWHQHDADRNKPKELPSGLAPESELGTGKSNFPFGTSEPGPAPTERDDGHKRARLKRLRDHANYLAPGGGINYWSGVGAVLRAILLNLLVWIPLIGFLFFLVGLLDQAFRNRIPALIAMDLPFLSQQVPVLFKVALLLIAFILVIFPLVCTLYSLVSTHEEGQISKYSILYLVITLALWIIFALVQTETFFVNPTIYGVEPDTYLTSVLAIIILLTVVFVLKAASKWFSFWLPKGIGEAYEYRRWLDYGFGGFFPFFVMIIAFSVIPIISEHVSSASSIEGVRGFLFGLFAVGSGTAASLWGYYQLFRNYAPKLATSVFLAVGGAVFLLGIAVLGYYFAINLHDALDTETGPAASPLFHALDTETGAAASPLFHAPSIHMIALIVLGISLLSAFMVNINQISLNRFYRDRLMEAYMPCKNSIYRNTREYSPADTLCLSNLWPPSAAPNGKNPKSPRWVPPGPYPLINTNVVLVNDANPKLRLRGGDNFLLAPYFCGSEATGWSKTKKAFPQISLATAMAASAAAVNPFTGYVGTGPTRNRLVSIVLALLNLRLGVWVRNPVKRCLLRQPNHIVPGLLYAITRGGHRHHKSFLELTDGGHFDNLGLYELVRRKCKVILVCDGEMDRKTSYAALVSVQRRIKDDFDAQISFHPHQGPELLVENISMDYPSDAFMANQTFFVATIAYSDGSNGKIIYIKARMIKDLSFEVKAYKGAHMDFPHEATTDQFFDPEQFDAHSELGYRACSCADADIEKAQATVSGAPLQSTRH